MHCVCGMAELWRITIAPVFMYWERIALLMGVTWSTTPQSGALPHASKMNGSILWSGMPS